jgi:hypothetical protein
MSGAREDSYVNKLSTVYGKKSQVVEAVEGVRRAIEPLILPDRAKILAAIAADVMTDVEKRNQRRDVNAACAALRAAIATLEAVGPNLDG